MASLCRCCGEELVTENEKKQGICAACDTAVTRKVNSRRGDFPFLSRPFNTAWQSGEKNTSSY